MLCKEKTRSDIEQGVLGRTVQIVGVLILTIL